MEYLPYKLAVLGAMFPTVPPERIDYLDDWTANPWGGRNPQPDCACGRGHIPSSAEIDQLAHSDVSITCDCGRRFTLTQAFRHAIDRDYTPASAHLFISNAVEMAAIKPIIPSLEAVFFKTDFERVLRVDLQVGYSVSDVEHLPGGALGAFLALPHYVTSDGFSFLTVPTTPDLPEVCTVTYSAYGYMKGVDIALWVRRVHSARRLAEENDFDAAIAMLGVATEAFVRWDYLQQSGSGLSIGDPHEKRAWRGRKASGFANVVEAACARVGLAAPVFDDWRDQVWLPRHPSLHGDERPVAMPVFRSALDAMLALLFALRPSAMLELAGVTVP